MVPGLQGWYKHRGHVELLLWSRPKGRNVAMPVVRLILREGQEKLYHEAQASMHTPDRTLRIIRNQDKASIMASATPCCF